MGTLDGMMSMSKHYEMGDDRTAISVKADLLPFSSEDLPVCPQCRGSLRNVARYGRIIRRALLDENAKKFTARSNAEHHRLAEQLEAHQRHLQESLEDATSPSQNLVLVDAVADQLTHIRTSLVSKRYQAILALRSTIARFVKKVSREEQPYQRVKDLVEAVRRSNRDKDIFSFDFDETKLQLREHLLARVLLARCDLMILSDVVGLFHAGTAFGGNGKLRVDFAANRSESDLLVAEAMKTFNFRQQVEAYVFWARLAAMECTSLDMMEDDDSADADTKKVFLRTEATSRLREAESICNQYTGPTEGLIDEVRLSQIEDHLASIATL